VDQTTAGPYGNVVQSNLTVSIGSAFSFDDLRRVRVLGVPMLISMVFCGLGGVMLRVRSVAMGCVSMMRAFFVVTVLVVFGGGAMVLGRVFVVLRGFVMMIDVVFGHGILS
jgi:hypothetical protein